MTWYNQSWI